MAGRPALRVREVAPGGGESLNGVAAPCTNRSARGRGAGQSSRGAGPGGAQPGGRSLVPERRWLKLCLCAGLLRPRRVGTLIVMGTEARAGRKQLLLFTSVILCKFPEFREESVGRGRGWKEALPTPLARGRGGVEKPASLTLLVPLSFPPLRYLPSPSLWRWLAPLPHTRPLRTPGRGPRPPHEARNYGGGSPTSPSLTPWGEPCAHPPRRAPPHAPGKGHPAPQQAPDQQLTTREKPEPGTADCPQGRSNGGQVRWASLCLAVAEGLSLAPLDLWGGGGCSGKSVWLQTPKRK